jgi:energy-coupling factor transport system substrate-specific component
MSTTDKHSSDERATGTRSTDTFSSAVTGPGAHPRLTTTQVAGIAAALVAGAVIWAVGLPSGSTLFGTTASELTVPLALFVAFAGIALVGALTTRSAAAWRVVDIVVAAVLGVAGGFFFWGVATVWTPITTPLSFYPPASALLAGLWLVPGVLGALVIRKPGAAVFTELVAAVLEALLGNQWGFSTVYYGLVEGLGAEFVVALFLYRRFGLPAAVLTGAGAGVAVGLLDTFVYYPDFSPGYKSAYVVFAVVSGAVIAGFGGWALTRALARTGALAPLASGRAAERV